MEDLDPLGISQMRRIQRVGWTNRSGEQFDLARVGVYDRCEFQNGYAIVFRLQSSGRNSCSLLPSCRRYRQKRLEKARSGTVV